MDPVKSEKDNVQSAKLIEALALPRKPTQPQLPGPVPRPTAVPERKRELKINVQTSSDRGFQKKRILETDDGQMALSNETITKRKLGGASICLGDICQGSVSLHDVNLDFSQDGLLVSVMYMYKPE
ncbi:hypothetical protein DPMN_101967 [Dreissena polymorpha]|uniref:Uncharacterized protein n=1 Tax=Dreissena polymorpha TaxID=45954 RepID=A0A9D4LIF6_DREPO|nr:hypothetical protein DPMN_101967 [Dreissena polymorpha]